MARGLTLSDRTIGKLLMALPLFCLLSLILAVAAFRRATISEPSSSLALEYHRLDRFAEPTWLRVRVPPGAAGADKRLRLNLNRAYIEAVRITRVEPEPEDILSQADGWTFVFRLQDPAQPSLVVFQVEGISYGQLNGQVAVTGRPGLPFKQYMLP